MWCDLPRFPSLVAAGSCCTLDEKGKTWGDLDEASATKYKIKGDMKAGTGSKGTGNEGCGRKKKDVERQSNVWDLCAAVQKRFTYFRSCFSM